MNGEKNILIVCQQGISRSVTMVIGYLILYYKQSFENAFNFVKSKRHNIDPNFGFILFLQSLPNR